MELAGFSTFDATHRAHGRRDASRINPTLQLPAIAESVTVTAATPLIETSATVRTTTVDEEAIRNLPINGRRFQDFITLTPTVQVDTSRGQLSFAGQRGINSNVSIDGADYNQPFFGGIRGGERSNNAFTIPQEAIQEFQVVAAGYSAEFGRSTGGLVNAITKSGTNTHARLAVLREPPPRLGRAERVRPDRGADAAAVRRVDRRTDLREPAVLLRRRRAAAVQEHPQRRLQPGRRHAGRRHRGGVQLLQEASRSRSTRPTTPRRILGRVDYQMRYRQPSRRPLQLQQQQGDELATPPATRCRTRRSAPCRTTARRRTAPTPSSANTPRRCARTSCSRARGQYSREERPRDANALQPTAHGPGRQRRHGELPRRRTSSVTGARQARCQCHAA